MNSLLTPSLLTLAALAPTAHAGDADLVDALVADIRLPDGVVHVIDEVLLPPSE